MPRIRSIHWKKFEKFLLEIGCKFKREKGDHRVYWKEGIKRPIIIPRDTSLPVFIILNNLKVLGVSREDYLNRTYALGLFLSSSRMRGSSIRLISKTWIPAFAGMTPKSGQMRKSY